MDLTSEKKDTTTTSLFVDNFVDSRTQDIAVHFPPTGVPRISRDYRRRATSNVRTPFYFNKNNPTFNHNRDARFKYLELHNWNSKRMRMRPLWGWMLPFSQNQRAVSSCLKLLSKRELIYDLSYTEAFVLRGEPSRLHSMLDLFSNHSFKGSSLQAVPFYSSVNNSATLIGYVDILMESPSSFLLLVHPSIADIVSSMITEHLDDSYVAFITLL